jgi:hypothetical protein
MDKLKTRWGITSNFQIFLILLVFAINGTLATRLADPLTHAIGLDRSTTTPYLYWPVRILLIFPIYQITLVFVGAIFGQFQFFWNMEKKMLKRIGFKRFFKD